MKRLCMGVSGYCCHGDTGQFNDGNSHKASALMDETALYAEWARRHASQTSAVLLRAVSSARVAVITRCFAPFIASRQISIGSPETDGQFLVWRVLAENPRMRRVVLGIAVRVLLEKWLASDCDVIPTLYWFKVVLSQNVWLRVKDGLSWQRAGWHIGVGYEGRGINLVTGAWHKLSPNRFSMLWGLEVVADRYRHADPYTSSFTGALVIVGGDGGGMVRMGCACAGISADE